MRCSQPIGLTKEANEFLEANAKRTNECPNCHRYDDLEKVETTPSGMYGDVPHFIYTLKDGGRASSFVQYCEWSSGPMEWFGLTVFDKDGKQINQFLWAKEDIEEMVGRYPF